MSRITSGSTVAFFALTYAVAWAFFIPIARSASATMSPVLSLLALIGTFAPAMVALALTARDEGEAGVRALLERTLRWRVAARWYVFAASYFVIIKLSVALIIRLSSGAWPRFGTEPWYLIPAAILISTPIQAGEEIGWRGYALPRLAARFGLGPASLVLGVMWACWHLPLFFVHDADKFGQSFFVYVLQLTALSVAMAWLFARTGGSLSLVMLLHSAVNNSKDIVPSAIPGAANTFRLAASTVGWLTVTLLWIAAAYFLARMPKLELEEAQPSRNVD